MTTFKDLRKKYGGTERSGKGDYADTGYIYRHAQPKSIIRIISDIEYIVCHTVERDAKTPTGKSFTAYDKQLCRAHGKDGEEREGKECQKCAETKATSVGLAFLIDRTSDKILAGLLPFKFVDALLELEKEIGDFTNLTHGWDIAVKAEKGDDGFPEYTLRALKQTVIHPEDYKDVHFPTYDEIFDAHKKRTEPGKPPPWFHIHNPFKEKQASSAEGTKKPKHYHDHNKSKHHSKKLHHAPPTDEKDE